MIRRIFLKSLAGLVFLGTIPGTAIATIAAKKPKPFTGTMTVVKGFDATTCTMVVEDLVFVDGILQAK